MFVKDCSRCGQKSFVANTFVMLYSTVSVSMLLEIKKKKKRAFNGSVGVDHICLAAFFYCAMMAVITGIIIVL
jgi:hypothetical protein